MERVVTSFFSQFKSLLGQVERIDVLLDDAEPLSELLVQCPGRGIIETDQHCRVIDVFFVESKFEQIQSLWITFSLPHVNARDRVVYE